MGSQAAAGVARPAATWAPARSACSSARRTPSRDRQPVPGQVRGLGDGPDARTARAPLGGGEGYFFKKGIARPDQGRPEWLAFEKLTPGKGQFDYVRAKPTSCRSACRSPSCTGDARQASRSPRDRKENANIQVDELRAYFEGTPACRSRSSRRTRRRSTRCSTARCPAVLTNPNANIDSCCSDAEKRSTRSSAKASRRDSGVPVRAGTRGPAPTAGPDPSVEERSPMAAATVPEPDRAGGPARTRPRRSGGSRAAT